MGSPAARPQRVAPQPGGKGQLPTARPHGATPRPGLPLARAVAPVGAAPHAHEVSPEGSNAYRRGSCTRRRRAAPSPTQGSGDGGGLVSVREEGYDILLGKG
ncbi:hypothetical protein BHM03_00032380 [Ensete ventricosum]|nr:hypothetical protein BHM03_00032380 [Ensete ventricosum]